MNVKLTRSEIDALFLATEDTGGDDATLTETIVCCEAKGRRDDILEDQLLRQVEAVFGIPAVTQNVALPIAIKAVGPSEIYVVEFEPVNRADVATTTELRIASDAVYTFTPPIPGIGN
jgi:hypothetical protein